MYRIDDPSNVPVCPAPEAAENEGFYTEGVPGVSPATLVRASWLNMVQEELRNIVLAAAIVPAKTTYNQVLTALQTLFGRLATPNTWTAAQQGAFVPVQPPINGGTLILNFAQGNNFVVGAGPSITGIAASFILGTPSNVVPGQSGIITFVQGAVGGFTITSRTTSWIGPNGTRVQLTAGPNGRDSFLYYVDYDNHIVVSAAGNVS
ncbi:MAG TPA: hypothetical protein VNW52_10570 [Burkholderiaceae bacterium]|jgi:hypothetical protein|nr:hypothetical protein [Burkholderiaceae bacterium]